LKWTIPQIIGIVPLKIFPILTILTLCEIKIHVLQLCQNQPYGCTLYLKLINCYAIKIEPKIDKMVILFYISQFCVLFFVEIRVQYVKFKKNSWKFYFTYV